MTFPTCSVPQIGIVACGYGFTSIGFRLLMEPIIDEDKMAILPSGSASGLLAIISGLKRMFDRLNKASNDLGASDE
jgi:hypothetical protein